MTDSASTSANAEFASPLASIAAAVSAWIAFASSGRPPTSRLWNNAARCCARRWGGSSGSASACRPAAARASGGIAEHPGDAEEHLGLLLRRQRVPEVRVGELAGLVHAPGGMEQDRGLREQRPAQCVVARGELQSPPAEVGTGPGVGARQCLAGAQQDRDRLLVAGLGARRDLRRHLDRRGAGGHEQASAASRSSARRAETGTLSRAQPRG